MTERIAIYTTIDGNYLNQGIIALKSFMRFYPEFDFFIIGNKDLFDDSQLNLISFFNINFLHCDKNKKFEKSSSWWPSTCYLMLFAPEMLYKEGYKYSLGIDADVLCTKKFDIKEIFDNTYNFSGIKNYPIIGNLHSQYREKFIEKNKLSKIDLDLFNPNTGVMFWNNQKMAELDFSENISNLYEKYNEKLIYGDQALFAIYILLNKVQYNILSYKYNFRTGDPDDSAINPCLKDLNIIHYTSPKPWKSLCKKKNFKYNKKWWEFGFKIMIKIYLYRLLNKKFKVIKNGI